MFWIGLGIGLVLGTFVGFVLCAILTSGRMAELEEELIRSRSLERWVLDADRSQFRF